MSIDDATYRDWIARFDTVSGAELESARRFARTLPRRPRIDVVMPVFDPAEAFLREAIASVRSQIYDRWTLCICDDGSRLPHVRRLLAQAEREDARIRVCRNDTNGGIARATNAAIALGTGEFVAFVDHDDVIPPHAFLLVAHHLGEAPLTNLIYSDFDFLDEQAARTKPFFKPDYDPEVHLGLNLVSCLTLHRRTVLEKVRGMRAGYPGSEDYDLGLRVVEAVPEDTIRHIPHVLYHWRVVPSSSSRARTSTAVDSARRAVAEHCKRAGLSVSVGGTPRSLIWNRVRALPTTPPSVTLVSWGARPERMEHVRHRYRGATAYDALSVSDLDPGRFGSAAAFRNEAVARAATELVVFVEARCTPRTPDWLTEMVSHFSRAACAVVGARTIGPDGRIEQCGMLLGVQDGASDLPVGRAFYGLAETEPSYFGRDEMAARASCVSGGAVVVRKSAVEALGGFDERFLAPTALDVDLCLRAVQRGSSVIFCPHAVLAASRDAATENEIDSASLLREKWGGVLCTDPYYNPNLTNLAADFGLASPPRARFPWQAHK